MSQHPFATSANGTFEALATIELLNSWAPKVLAMGAKADPRELRDIIALRIKVEEKVIEDNLREKPALFFALLRADRACAPLCSTLLYLSADDAREVAGRAGGSLNPLSWYGIHEWDLCGVLPAWVQQINESVTSPIADSHPAEVARAFEALRVARGREYVNTFFVDPQGLWREWIDSDDRIWLSKHVENLREAIRENPRPLEV